MASLSVSTLFRNAGTSEESDSIQTGQSSAAIFGAVGGALAVVMVAVVLIVVVTVVMIATKRRKFNHQYATGKGTKLIIVLGVFDFIFHFKT